MAAKPLTSEAIALTEKKMDMALDDIIKMSKGTTTKAKNQRVSNKSQNFLNSTAQEKSSRVRRFMDSRSSLRQGVLARRRSNFQGNQFPLATEVARKAAVAPIRNRAAVAPIRNRAPVAPIRNRAFNHNRMVNWNKPRVGAPPVQRNVANGGFAVKQRQQQQQVKVVSKQKPKTLDSLFANMKEQRMRGLSHQNNAGQRNGGGQLRQPWGRGRFGNYTN